MKKSTHHNNVKAIVRVLSLVLGQKKGDKKSNEITAVPELLEAIDLKGTLITADAMSCQKSITETCLTREADYLLAVKGNQKTLHQDIQATMEQYWQEHPQDQVSDRFYKQENQGHGRREYCCCWVFDDTSALSTHEEWTGLKRFGVVQSDRIINGKATTAFRYYITSKELTAGQLLNATRMHWQVENNLHWMLDISFNEDASQTRHENAAEQLATLRRIALNILKSDASSKRSIRSKSKRAGWNNKYLAQLLESYVFTGA